MKIISVYISVIATLLIIGGCTSPVAESSYRVGYDFSQVDKIAIIAVEGAVKNESAKNQIAQFFAMELLKKGYAPIGRARVKALLAEHELSIDPNTAEGATQAGQILKVPVVLLVSIPYFGEQISMTAVMLDAQDGSYLWIGSDSGRTGGSGALSTILGTEAEAGPPSRAESEPALGGIIAEQLTPAGQALTPSEANNVQTVIRRLCRSLPPRASQKKEKRWF
ncbi:MAG: hypothetical protein ACE5NM_11895 [Sedimentisphaerales bacterium]